MMHTRTLLFIYILCTLLLAACAGKKENNNTEATLEVIDENPPAPGFNIEGSDPEAIYVADKVMRKMGGRKAWDRTRYISWTFFGRRKLLWDKHSGDVRIDYIDSDKVILVNIHTSKGKVWKDGGEMTNPDSLASYLSTGKSDWINDSYWLVMPFKLKDTGVTLHWIGQDTTKDGRDAHFFQMSFENVGDTPDNLYNIWVDAESELVSQWAYFKSDEDTEARFTTPWADYQKYGEILLSGNRGRGQLTDINVLTEIPKGVFDSFDKYEL